MVTESRTTFYHLKIEYFYYGIWNVLTDGDFVTTHTLRREKTSVNTGNFVPGIYRVNAYDVIREDVQTGESGVDLKFETVYNNIQYRFSYTGYMDTVMLTGSPLPVHPSSITKLKELALLKAYSKLGRAEFSIGEDLGELRETILMLRDPLLTLRKFLSGRDRFGNTNLTRLKDLITYNQCRQFRSLTGKRAAKAATDTWLELRYGWRPLIGSIGTVIEAIQAVEDKNFDPNTIRSCRSKLKSEIESKVDSFLPFYPGGGKGTLATVDTYTVRASVQYRQSRPYTMVEKLGITPSYWPETAWELTRLSFVVDWFVSIKPWLQRFRVTPEITVLGSTVGTKLESISRTESVTVTLGAGYGDPNPHPVPNGSFKTRNWYVREVGVKPPALPVFRGGSALDLSKTLDLISLIGQSLMKK